MLSSDVTHDNDRYRAVLDNDYNASTIIDMQYMLKLWPVRDVCLYFATELPYTHINKPRKTIYAKLL